jgi:hypothetical protein
MLRWRGAPRDDTRVLAMLLLALSVTARLRRGFEHVEWFHFLLELPAYVLVLRHVVRAAPAARVERALGIVLLALLGAGIFAYRDLGIGPLTELSGFETVHTPRGDVRMPPGEARRYTELRAALEQIDAGGQRPLFAFGKTGGVNYFTGRHNPTSATHGFLLSHVDPAQVVRQLQETSPAPIIVDIPLIARVRDYPARPDLRRWRPGLAEPLYAADRPWLERATAGCRRAAGIPEGDNPFLVVYDCAAPSAVHVRAHGTTLLAQVAPSRIPAGMAQ